MVERDEILGTIRAFYGREAGDETEVAQLEARNFEDAIELSQSLVNSPEFVARFYGRLDPSPYMMPAVYKEQQIDCEATDAQLDKLLSRIQGEWEEFGRTEPHWSVLTSEQFKQDSIASNEDEFFGSGAHVLNLIRSLLERQGMDLSSLDTCFELGCGVGRITIHLAEAFKHVIAADISRFHLEICDKELLKRQVGNVRLNLLDSPYAVRNLPDFDFFCSFIVLQHNPPPVMTFLLDAILGKLRPGGVAVFQLPVAILGYRFDLDHYLDAPDEPHMEMHVLPQTHLLRVLARNGCRLLEIREDGWIGARDRSISNTVFAIKDGVPN